jgi:hypothetical protein
MKQKHKMKRHNKNIHVNRTAPILDLHMQNVINADSTEKINV